MMNLPAACRRSLFSSLYITDQFATVLETHSLSIVTLLCLKYVQSSWIILKIIQNCWPDKKRLQYISYPVLSPTKKPTYKYFLCVYKEHVLSSMARPHFLMSVEVLE